MEKQPDSKYERAKKKVKAIKGFYEHLTIYIIVNLTLQIIKSDVLNFIMNGKLAEWDVQNWWNWNVHSVWFFWGIALAIHAFSVFKGDIGLGKDWEKRKIREIMKEEEESNNEGRWT